MTTETKTKRQEKLERREDLNDLIAVMSTPQGRRFIWRLLTKARIFSSPYAGSTNDTMMNLGEHNLGLFVMTEVIDACPDKYLLMQNEHYMPPEPSEADKPAEEESND